MNTNTTSPFAKPSKTLLRRAAGLAPRRLVRGVTLVETMAVMAIIAILSGMAAPSMSAMMDSVKLSSASNVFLSSLHLARGEAIKRNTRAALCKSADGVACASRGGWEQGWIVFHDANNNGTREATETLVHHEQPLSSSLRLTGNLNVARYVSFSSSGATKLLGGGFQAGTLTVCHHSFEGGEARQIILNAVGRPRVQKTRVTSCA